MSRLHPVGTTGDRTTLAMWRRRHVDVVHAERMLDMIRRALPIIGSATRPTTTNGGKVRYVHGMCSVSHERLPGMGTRIRVVVEDDALDMRITGRQGPGEHIPMPPQGDPDPARFTIAAVEMATAAVEALNDASTSFEVEEPSPLIDEVVKGAQRAAILANAADRSSIVLRAPWMRASITTPEDVRIGLPLESSIQFDVLPDMVSFHRLWVDDIDPEMREIHVEITAFDIDMDASDVVGNMRLAGGPTIVPGRPATDSHVGKGMST
jgi:hypothetical protein